MRTSKEPSENLMSYLSYISGDKSDASRHCRSSTISNQMQMIFSLNFQHSSWNDFLWPNLAFKRTNQPGDKTYEVCFNLKIPLKKMSQLLFYLFKKAFVLNINALSFSSLTLVRSIMSSFLVSERSMYWF